METTPAAPDQSALPMRWVRDQFPALAGDWVLMDNAGGSAPLASVIERIGDYMRHWPVQLGASYQPSAEAGALLDESRAALAGMMTGADGTGPDRDELIVGTSTTALIANLARAMRSQLAPGDEIVVTDTDHEANITPWRRLEASGIVTKTWRLNMDSQRLETSDLEPLLSERTRLVAFTHASNLLGEATPVAEITRLAHAHGAHVCVDGVAYAPHRPLPVRDWDVDYYVFSLYKVYGPHCAIMTGRRELLAGLDNINHQFMDAASAPGKLEPGAFPYELLYGAAAVPAYLRTLGQRVRPGAEPLAAAYAAIAAQEHRLTSGLLDYLNGRQDVEIMGARTAGPTRLPTISFAVAGRASSEIPPLCEPAHIGIRWGHFYAPRLVERLGLTDRDGVVRVSMVHYNTLAELGRLIEALDAALSGHTA
jgi:cysteine desulfurase family protein (TIGR01976 family)